MKRKLFAIITSVLLLCAMLPLGALGVSAETSGVYNGMTYEIVDGEVTITGYTDELSAELVIPDTIADYPVTTIGRYAFRWCQSLISATIPDSVTSISEYAFGNCEALTSVTISNGITAIENWLFCGCRSLVSIIIPDSVTTIGWHAFTNCVSLVSVTIPDNVTTIDFSAFDYCTSLTSVTIPNGVTSLEDWTFGYCTSLASVIIPESVTHIGYAVFSNCSSLTDVYYGGSKKNKANIAVGSDNDRFLYAAWHYAADPISTTVKHSVMDTANGSGLAFRFELTANGVAMKNGTEVDLTNATINYLGKDCKLLGMGTVVTNKVNPGTFTLADVNGVSIVDIPTVYLQEANEDSCAFATRIIDIPDTQLERILYARPYYVVEVDGEEIVVYGDVDSATCAAYM